MPWGPSSNEGQAAGPPQLTAEAVEVLQGATRVLAGIALQSVDALDGAVSLAQLRLLAVLADLARPALARWLGRWGWRHPRSPGWPTAWLPPVTSGAAATRATGAW